MVRRTSFGWSFSHGWLLHLNLYIVKFGFYIKNELLLLWIGYAFYYIFKNLLFVCLLAYVHECATTHVWNSELSSLFFPSTVWIPGTKLWLTGSWQASLAAEPFHWPILNYWLILLLDNFINVYNALWWLFLSLSSTHSQSLPVLCQDSWLLVLYGDPFPLTRVIC